MAFSWTARFTDWIRNASEIGAFTNDADRTNVLIAGGGQTFLHANEDMQDNPVLDRTQALEQNSRYILSALTHFGIHEGVNLAGSQHGFSGLLTDLVAGFAAYKGSEMVNDSTEKANVESRYQQSISDVNITTHNGQSFSFNPSQLQQQPADQAHQKMVEMFMQTGMSEKDAIKEVQEIHKAAIQAHREGNCVNTSLVGVEPGLLPHDYLSNPVTTPKVELGDLKPSNGGSAPYSPGLTIPLGH